MSLDENSDGLSGLSEVEVDELLERDVDLRDYWRGFGAACRAIIGIARELLRSIPGDDG